MEVVVPAAGLGSRFLPVTAVVAKELLPLGRLPLIHHALVEAELAGFGSATIVITPRKTALRAYFEGDLSLESQLFERGDHAGAELLRNIRELGNRMRLRFVEQAEPTGLGGAILACRGHVTPPFAVLLPDDVVETVRHWQQMLLIHAESGGDVLCIREVPEHETHRFGIAECIIDSGQIRVVGLAEKPERAVSRLAIFGRYIVSDRVLHALSTLPHATGSELQLTAGFGAVLGKEPPVLAVRFTDHFYDCGTPEAYSSSVARYADASATCGG